jgi:aryl-alcohol dehydrogenase-like predicted oxidoreductase
MQYRRLGRTGLNVSILSLGSGGPNQFGQLRYVSRENIHRLVRHALDLGMNYFDTAAGYAKSESLLGDALRGVPRDQYYLATKLYPLKGNRFLSAAEARQLVERSLRRLRLDALDLLYLHRIVPQRYPETLERLLPLLLDLRAEGKIRYIGISESSTRDRSHRMLGRALADDHFDAVMVAYEIAHGGAEKEIFPLALARDVGVVGMVAARNLVHRTAAERLKLSAAALLSLVGSPPRPSLAALRLRMALATLRRSGPSAALSIPRQGGEGILQLPAAGYTFAVSHPAVVTVLTGTTNPEHLEQNVQAALAPALTSGEIEALREMLRRQG